jgi:flavin-dependent dehydrogenase
MNREFDILIAGGGMVGLTVALLLAQGDTDEQLNITVVDAGDRPSFEPDQDVSLRVSAIASGTASLLDRLGIWEDIADTRACPYRDMRVWDAFGSVEGPETLHFDAAEFAVPQLGFIVENILIQDALLTALAATSVSVNYATRIKSVQKSGNRYVVEYGDGQTMKPELMDVFSDRFRYAPATRGQPPKHRVAAVPQEWSRRPATTVGRSRVHGMDHYTGTGGGTEGRDGRPVGSVVDRRNRRRTRQT